MSSWKPEVEVGGKWHRNGLVFSTREEAEANAVNLYARWTATTGWRAVESTDPVNYRWVNGKLEDVA